MIKILLVGLGGFLGSISRYLMSGLVQQIAKYSFFPIGTLSVNVLGSFLIGLLVGISEEKLSFSPELRLFLIIGFLGGFTTFSTFSLESFHFLKDGQYAPAAINIFLQLMLGIFAVTGGYILSKVI